MVLPILLIGGLVGFIAHSFSQSREKEEARRSRIHWYPCSIKEHGLIFLDLSRLTKIQAEVYAEDAKTKDKI